MSEDKLIENPFFKIITPVYNTSKYLDKCIKSVLNQTFKDWFWILVDDLSTDGSYEKLLEYEKQYPEHIKVIRVKEKCYEGKARNTANLFNIDCKYVFYIDSDDWLADENVFQRVYDCAEKNNSPDVIFNPYIFLSRGKSENDINNCNDLDFVALYEGCAPWKYIVKSSINKLARFSESFASDDIIWHLSILDNAKSIVVSDGLNYIYNNRSETSVTFNKRNAFKNSLRKLSKFIVYNDLNSISYIKSMVNKRKQKYLNDIENEIPIDFKISSFKKINYDLLIKNSLHIDNDHKIDLSFFAKHDYQYVLLYNDAININRLNLQNIKFYTNFIPADADYIILNCNYVKNDISLMYPYNAINNINDIDGINLIILLKSIYINNLNLINLQKDLQKFNGYIIDNYECKYVL